MTSTRIDFFRPNERYGELSNFYALATPIVWRGKSYATSEHLYQAMKFLGPGATKMHQAYADLIRRAKTPNMAKILAAQRVPDTHPWRVTLGAYIAQSQRQNVHPRADWDDVKAKKMLEVLLLKFEQDAHCRDVLLATGEAQLAEVSPYDYYWGTGSSGDGENMLGKLLVETRTILRTTKQGAKRKLKKSVERVTKEARPTPPEDRLTQTD